MNKRMNRCIASLLLVSAGMLVFANNAFSQRGSLRLNGFASYAFDDRVDGYASSTSYFEGKIKGGFHWGIGLEYMARPNLGVDLTYYRQDTDAPMDYYNPLHKTRDFDLAANYILLGSTSYWRVNEIVEPYLGAQAGLGILSVSNKENGNDESATKFAWGVKGGSNFWVTDKMALKLNLGLISVAQAVGGGLYFGTGGVGTGISTYSSMLQFTIGSGLAFRLGAHK